MDNEQEMREQETPVLEAPVQEVPVQEPPAQEPEENVVSVWYGSGNTKWFRRRRFEGYTQYETLEPNGKRVMHHVYTGYYYTQELDKRGRLTHRLAYTALALVAGAALLFGATRTVAANIHWPGGVPAFAGLFGLAWVLYGVVNELLVPQKRTIGDYRATSLSELRGAMVAAVASGVLALVTLGYAIVVRTDVGLHLAAAAAELVAGVLALIIWRMEKKVKYTESRSELAGKYTM